MASFSHQFTSLCFFGHSHVPRIYVEGSIVTQENTDTILLEPDRKYLINPGSGDVPPRAACAIYDQAPRRVHHRRVPYDSATAREKNRAAGLPWHQFPED